MDEKLTENPYGRRENDVQNHASGPIQVARLGMIVTVASSFNILARGQLEYLVRSGFSLNLFCDGSQDDLEVLSARRVGSVSRIPMRRAPHPLLDLISLVQLTQKLFGRRFDGWICGTPKAMLLGALAGWITRQPNRIAIVHGRAYELFRGPRRRLYLLLDRMCFACVHQVIFVSDSLRDAYRADGLRLEHKGRVLGWGSYNGVDVARFRPLSAIEAVGCRAALSLPVKAFVVVIAGRLVRDKGVFDVIKLIKRLQARGLFWVFVGQCEDEEAMQQIKLLDPLYVRHVPHTERIETWFQAADLHLFLTRREGFGNVAVEAAACGTPTFAQDVVGVRDSVIDGTTGRLFSPGDLASLEEAIVDASRDPVAFRQRYPKARETVRARFEQSDVWRRYAAAYVSATSAAAAPQAVRCAV